MPQNDEHVKAYAKAINNVRRQFNVEQDHSFTFSPTGVLALMAKMQIGEPDEYVEPEPVELWGPQNEPMVIWGGVLRDATALEDFRGLTQGRRLVGVIPGGGWRLHDEGAEEYPEVPVIAWAITAGAKAIPIIADTHHTASFAGAPADESLLHRPSEGEPFVSRLIPPEPS